ncbi:NAD(P)/FAD-dependent oxidoreductase [Aerosakkonema funiforme]|uniref:Tryptophan 7-halogenase n=2 Tax=Oscillatoriophycideae TaxID=1301283 RepID=A0A926VLK5_9CYAN|nr:tryptophan 7-halogenase [Aerosakkonema funiforme]MBD2186131.1 tryptophan 7-halogenase [Aerosakkonema funiforme FACHB-1375]
MNSAGNFDVAILGTGFSGSILGAILARQGYKVLLIDEKEHPRFAIGEATIPQTTMMMRIIADRYDVPEIGACSTFEGMHQYVTSHCGVKTNFGFVYQQAGQAQNPQEVTQNIIPHLLVGYDSHWFRQDVDAYLLTVAIKYGATVRQNTNIVDLAIDESKVFLKSDRGEEFFGRYLVDSTGFKSILAKKFDLRESPCRFKTHSRALFNHFIGVKPYDECIDSKAAWGVPQAWHDGTMHHLFAGGWMWVIPFGNHPKSNSPLCSIGLSLDTRHFPKTNLTPQQEFDSILAKFPGIAPQFKNARPVREWVSTDRLQYSSKRCVGDRFCLTAQAAGTIDALFSRGMANTVDGLYALAGLLLKALEDDDFSAERFEYIDRLQQRLLDYNDRLVHCSFIAFSDFALWNAWYRVWSFGGLLNVFRIKKMQERYQETGDLACFSGLNDPLYLGSLCPDLQRYEELFEQAASTVEAVGEGLLSPKEASDKILNLFKQSDFVPSKFEFHSAQRHFNCQFNFDDIVNIFAWSKSPMPELQQLCF